MNITEKNLICIPLLDGNKERLLQHAEAVKKKAPDFIEWRVDYFDDIHAVKNTISSLKNSIGDIPLIFTCRCKEEGGHKNIEFNERSSLIIDAIETGLVDVVDIELCNKESFIHQIYNAAQKKKCKLLLSYHNFAYTPSEEFILNKLQQAQEYGADIAKVAVMPQNKHDVLVLLNATLKAKENAIRIPIITISMDTLGVISRIIGGEYGSYLTFAMDESASAPGQLHIDELRSIWKILQKD